MAFTDIFCVHFVFALIVFTVFSSCGCGWGQSHPLNPGSSQTTARPVSRQQQGETSSLEQILYGCVCGGCCSLNTRLCGLAINTVVTVPAGIVTRVGFYEKKFYFIDVILAPLCIYKVQTKEEFNFGLN